MSQSGNSQKGSSNRGQSQGNIRHDGQKNSYIQHGAFNEGAVHRPVPGQSNGNGGKRK